MISSRWKLACIILFAVLSLASVMQMQASVIGKVGYSGMNGGVTCTNCHSGGAAPAISFSGPTTVIPGVTNFYEFTIENGPAQTGGMNVAGSLGALHNGSDTRLEMGELTHTWPKNFSGSQASFAFSWTAPATVTLATLYGSGVSSNNQFNTDGDGVGSSNLSITVTQPIAHPGAVTLNQIASATKVTDLQHAGDGRLFIVEQAGIIRIYDGVQVLATPYLTITDRVNDSGNEMGLLGLAFHPAYATNGYFFVNYTATSALGQRITRISRFSVNGSNPDLANRSSEQILLEFPQPYTNHNGGAIHFGPDGYLYIASGDGGSANDPAEYSQNNGVLLGKLLRIDVDSAGGSGPDCDISGNSNYTIPSDNPLQDGAGGNCDEIWATGLRNPWRISFDRLTGDLWIADVGQWYWEEIDFAAAGNPGGQNYGWDCYEGDHVNPNDPSPTCTGNAADYDFPVHEYRHTVGRCSITGGYVYRGAAYSVLQGHYLFADYCTGELWTLSGTPLTPTLSSLALAPGSPLSLPRTFGEDAAGEMYVANGSAVYKIEDSAAAPVAPAPVISTYVEQSISLDWVPDAANCSYRVYGETSPYFAPGPGSLLHAAAGTETTYVVPAITGIPGINHYFLVRAINCSELSSADSSTLGAFDFALIPGS